MTRFRWRIPIRVRERASRKLRDHAMPPLEDFRSSGGDDQSAQHEEITEHADQAD